MNKKVYIKIGIYILLAIIAFIVIKYSKKYFDDNYQQHQTVESNLSLYKVNVDEERDAETQQEPKIIEQNPIKILDDEATIIIEEEVAEPTSFPLENEEETTQEPTPLVQENEDTQTIKNDATTLVTKNEEKQIPQKKIVKKSETTARTNTITKPKTLEKPQSVSKSVMQNPLFQSHAVQVGAFTTKKEADAHKIRIAKNKIASRYITEVKKAQNKALYKVVIGYFTSADEAKNICSQLKQQNVQCFATKI